MADKTPIPHELVSEHKILSKDDGDKILVDFKVSKVQIPRIKIKDSALAGKDVKAGQVIELKRPDGTLYYRIVVE